MYMSFIIYEMRTHFETILKVLPLINQPSNADGVDGVTLIITLSHLVAPYNFASNITAAAIAYQQQTE